VLLARGRPAQAEGDRHVDYVQTYGVVFSSSSYGTG
jgi:hypothetical protein